MKMDQGMQQRLSSTSAQPHCNSAALPAKAGLLDQVMRFAVICSLTLLLTAFTSAALAQPPATDTPPTDSPATATDPAAISAEPAPATAPASPTESTPAEQAPAATPATSPGTSTTSAAQQSTTPAAQRQGYLVRVPIPITGTADTQVEGALSQILSRTERGGTRPIVILEFSPTSGADGQSEAGRGSDFGRSLALAHFLTSSRMNVVQTVAYVPKDLKGHALLPIMACESIVMAPDAHLGDAGVDEEALGAVIRSGYAEIADSRKTIPRALALGMLDGQLEVYQVQLGGGGGGTEFVLAEDLEKLGESKTIVSQRKLEPRPGFYSGQEARQELGFVSRLVGSHEELAKALGIPVTATQVDPSLATGGWRPTRVQLRGPITSRSVNRVMRTIEDQIRDHQTNFVCLEIDSSGGSPSDSLDLAYYLANLDRDSIRTVAYIPNEARADAALIALACDQVVTHPGSSLGGYGSREFSQTEKEAMQKSFREGIARLKSRWWSLPVAMIDSEAKAYAFRNQQTGVTRYFNDQELAEQPDPSLWQRQGNDPINLGIDPLLLTGEQAVEYGLADNVVHSLDEFRAMFGLENDLSPVTRGWAAELIDALGRKEFAWILLMIAGIAVWTEFQSPGIGIGGFVGLVCFVLFFWSHFLNGTAGWLEILLFTVGAICVALEIFVLPGIGIFGLGGGLLVIFSLILASQTFVIPRNSYQLGELQNTLVSLFAAGLGILIAGVLMRRYLPSTPVFNRMLLVPPTAKELAPAHMAEPFAQLVGQQGVTTSPLLPAGKARLGDQLVDVISTRGEMLESGTPVVCVQVRGNRIEVDRIR